MGLFIAFVVIIGAVLTDFFWFDVERKRWGWMKNWSKCNRILFLSGFITVFFFIYLGMALKYI